VTAHTGSSLGLRRTTGADRPLLFAIYAAARAEEMARVPWDDAAKHAFLTMQFDAQDTYYRRQRPGAAYDVVLVDGEPAGRLYVDRGPDELVVMDIALLPRFRGRGVGTRLMRALMAEAAAGGVPVTLHVERFNRAHALYARLGFRALSDDGVHLLMRWEPPHAKIAS
jgi:ribosomal protein S18 acetylase RimI-like enzyme